MLVLPESTGSAHSIVTTLLHLFIYPITSLFLPLPPFGWERHTLPQGGDLLFFTVQRKGRSREDEPEKRSETRLEAEPIAAEGKPSRPITEPIGYGVADIAAELVRVVGDQPGRDSPIHE